MSFPLSNLAQRFRFNESLLSSVSAAFDPDDWAAEPDGGGNNAIWILGHLVTSRRFLLRQLGTPMADEPWEEYFGMGTQVRDPAAYPSPVTLIGNFRSAGEALIERCAMLDPQACAAAWGTTFPDGSDTISGGAHFLYMHEVYHLGQIGLLRRIRGKPGFA